MSITAVTPPADTFFRVFSNLPIAIPFSLIEFPLCGITYSVSPLQSFVNLSTQYHNITVFSNDPWVRGVFPTTLFANPITYGVNYNVKFNITMFDLCETA